MAFNQNASAGQVNFSAQEPITKVVLANQDVTSSTTLVDVSDLTLRIGKYERINFKYNIFYTTAAAGDIKYLIDTPASLTAYRVAQNGCDHAGAALASIITAEGSAIAITASGTDGCLQLTGTIENGATAGDIKFQFAQNTSDGTAATVREGSSVQYYRF
tara:strand:+ start:318 stop:797 length:480 start_codon:yes stop_codon:yes gene_type:complete